MAMQIFVTAEGIDRPMGLENQNEFWRLLDRLQDAKLNDGDIASAHAAMDCYKRGHDLVKRADANIYDCQICDACPTYVAMPGGGI